MEVLRPEGYRGVSEFHIPFMLNIFNDVWVCYLVFENEGRYVLSTGGLVAFRGCWKVLSNGGLFGRMTLLGNTVIP